MTYRPTGLLTIVLGACLMTAAAAAQTDTSLEEGLRLAEAGDIKGALAAYQAITIADPQSFEAHARLGGMQLLDQHYADAVESFQRAITLGDSSPRSFLGMGMAYMHMGKLGQARAALVEARTRRGGDTTEIDAVIAWIDQRGANAAAAH